MFRIISGKYKGKRLIAPKNIIARPTTDFAKEALFGILAHRVNFSQICVLDLFAGIGSITFEFASRGVNQIYMIENQKVNLSFILETIKKLELSAEISVIAQDVFSWIKKSKDTFDVIFADPPYELPLKEYENLVHIVLEENLLSSSGIFILEHSSKQKPIEHQYYTFTRKYGNVSFSFYEKNIITN